MPLVCSEMASILPNRMSVLCDIQLSYHCTHHVRIKFQTQPLLSFLPSKLPSSPPYNLVPFPSLTSLFAIYLVESVRVVAADGLNRVHLLLVIPRTFLFFSPQILQAHTA